MDIKSASYMVLRDHEGLGVPLSTVVSNFQGFLDAYAEHGLNTVAITWFNPVDEITGEIRDAYQTETFYTRPSIEKITALTQAAQDKGFDVIWKPHFVADNPTVANVNTVFAPNIDVDNFLAEVNSYWSQFAPLAENLGVDALILGTEHGVYANAHELEWREIIATARTSFSGQLTYDALGYVGRDYPGADDITFWDDLDFISLSYYNALLNPGDAVTYENAYQGIFDSPISILDTLPGVNTASILAQMAETWGKPVFFSEAGTNSREGALFDPTGNGGNTIDMVEHELWHRVILEVFSNYDWFIGVNWWDNHNDLAAPPDSVGWQDYFDLFAEGQFTFLGKPAGNWVQKYWADGDPTPALTIYGTRAFDDTELRDDVIFGGFRGDSIDGLGGDDTIRGEDGADSIAGNAGSDLIHGDQGDDLLLGDGTMADLTDFFLL